MDNKHYMFADQRAAAFYGIKPGRYVWDDEARRWVFAEDQNTPSYHLVPPDDRSVTP